MITSWSVPCQPTGKLYIKGSLKIGPAESRIYQNLCSFYILLLIFNLLLGWCLILCLGVEGFCKYQQKSHKHSSSDLNGCGLYYCYYLWHHIDLGVTCRGLTIDRNWLIISYFS
jgi:hypothetical protein